METKPHYRIREKSPIWYAIKAFKYAFVIGSFYALYVLMWAAFYEIW